MKEQAVALAIQILQLLSPVLVVLIGYAVQKLIVYIDTKTKSQALQSVINHVGHAAYTVVTELGNTVVSDLKKQNGGQLTPEAVTKLQADALAKLKTYMGINGLKLAADTLKMSDDDLNKFLAGNLESALAGIKGAT